jgi:hypothetical protein
MQCVNTEQRTYCRTLHDAALEHSTYYLSCDTVALYRYYMAEGVKLYSQETWRRFMGDHGRELVATHANAVADYYVAMTEVHVQRLVYMMGAYKVL